MANEKYIKGSQGTLARADGNAWKPVACLTSSSYTSTLEMLDKVNMCTNGETVQTPNSITRSVSIDGEIIDTTDLGGGSAKESYGELREAQEGYLSSQTPDQWRLSQGELGYLYFEGYISDLEATFSADADATFSATLTVQEAPSSTDPLEAE